MRIVFIGPPGAGKGTQSVRLVQYLDVPHISTGNMLREAKRLGNRLGELASEYMDSGRLVPDPIILEMIGKRLSEPDCSVGYLLDGFPRTLGQARSLDEHLEQIGTPLDVALELKVSDQEILRRLAERRSAAGDRRVDDDPSVIPTRLKQYRRQTMSLLTYYRNRQMLQTIDGLGTTDEVFARIKQVVDAVVNRAGSS